MTQQIDDRLQAFETENTMLIHAGAAVHTARQAATAYTLEELGIAEWVTKAQQQAQKVHIATCSLREVVS